LKVLDEISQGFELQLFSKKKAMEVEDRKLVSQDEQEMVDSRLFF